MNLSIPSLCCETHNRAQVCPVSTDHPWDSCSFVGDHLWNIQLIRHDIRAHICQWALDLWQLMVVCARSQCLVRKWEEWVCWLKYRSLIQYTCIFSLTVFWYDWSKMGGDGLNVTPGTKSCRLFLLFMLLSQWNAKSLLANGQELKSFVDVMTGGGGSRSSWPGNWGGAE